MYISVNLIRYEAAMRNAEAALHDACNVPVLEAAVECALVDGKSQGKANVESR